MNTPKLNVFYLIISALCFASAGWITYDFFSARGKPEAAAAADIVPEYDVSALADSALRVEIAVPNASFSPKAGTPFRMFGAIDPSAVKASGAGSGAKGSNAAQSKKPRLRLKGFMKNPPLAILEDARGETHIKGQGDRVHNAEIIAITENSVTFKDSSGTYRLTVEENR